MKCEIRRQWDTDSIAEKFSAGISLHSHTLHSQESLDFVYPLAAHSRLVAAILRASERRFHAHYGTALNMSNGWWTPPLGPYDAWKVESSQIEQTGRRALVSITDHDNIDAPVALQLLEECRGVPISFEWTVPFADTFLHLGIHNMPATSARSWFTAMRAYTADPQLPKLREILAEFAACPETLVIFNHPLWDEKAIGQSIHEERATEFLRICADSVHALELNGLRPWSENSRVPALARMFDKPVISGGDRHAVEPNAVINLTNAETFSEFAEEVRDGWSRVLFLSQYRTANRLRIAQSLLDVLRTYDTHSEGWKLWSDRVFFAVDGNRVQSLTELFGHSTPPLVRAIIGLSLFAGSSPLHRVLKEVWSNAEEVAQ